MHEHITHQRIVGRLRTWRVSGPIRLAPTPWRQNLIMYDWGTIGAKLLAQGLATYRIAAMYIEFENVGDPGDAVSVPTYDRSGGVAYYNSLSGSGVRDYLRVALTTATIDATDDTLFPGGNRVTFFGQTSGVTGVHGRAFSDANNSKIFGAALVAMVDEDDATQDLVLSRAYFAAADQQVKLSTSQVGIEWQVSLG